MAASDRTAESLSSGQLQLPVFLNVSITEYQLYPGSEGEGLKAAFPRGVSVVVGINGLGKTTFLNALFRLLAGPTDWKSRPIDKPAGATPTELGRWRADTYFQRRVADGAKRAIMNADVAFGGRVLSVRRRLHDLDILDLKLDGKPVPATEESYREQVCNLSGARTFADFFLLLRYLVFFLEERQPVIWDKSAQFDVLRVLFFDEVEATMTRSLFDQVQSQDSYFRNLRVQSNRYEKRLKEVHAALDVAPSVSSKIRDLETQIDAAHDNIVELEDELAGLDDGYAERRQLLERERIHLVERVREYEYAESQYFAQVFPPIDEVANHVLVGLAGGGGCLVCGNQEASLPDRIRTALEEGHCPVCDSPQEAHEHVHPPKALADLRLSTLDSAVQELRQHTRTLSDEVDSLSARRREVQHRLASEESTRRQLKQEYQVLEGRLPPEAAEVASLKQIVAANKRELSRTREKIQKLAKEFGVALEAGETRVRRLAEQIQERFREYAQYFLADECTLEYALDRRAIAEGHSFKFPSFTPSLASGVFEKVSQPRAAPHEVSESQKEFIDLAFRMALISVACRDRSAMVVLETPEASLDVVFIARAGRLLSFFANQGVEPGNRVIASSNLNSTHMIPALFGALDVAEQSYLPELPSTTLARTEREERIINLLEIAVPNAAMEKYGDLYREQLDEALNLGTDGDAGGSP